MYGKENQMFGKRLSQYLGFQKVWLALIAAVGLARLGLSLAGLRDSTVTFLSMTVVGWGVGSLVLLITKRGGRRPAVAWPPVVKQAEASSRLRCAGGARPRGVHAWRPAVTGGRRYRRDAAADARSGNLRHRSCRRS